MTTIYCGQWVAGVPMVSVDGAPLVEPYGLCDEDDNRPLLDWHHECGAVCLAIAIMSHRLQVATDSDQHEATCRAQDLADEFASRVVAEFPAGQWTLSGDDVDSTIVDIEQDNERWNGIYLDTT